MSYYNDDKFQEECLSCYKRPKQMKGYIDSIRERILKPIECEVLIRDIENISQSRYHERLSGDLGKICTLMDDLVSLARAGNNKAQKYIKEKFQTSYNSIDAWKGVLNKYKDFLEKPDSTNKTNKKYKITSWKQAAKKIDGIIAECSASNGIESLLAKFSSHEDFVKTVVENSYFFSEKDVKHRFEKIKDDLKNRNPLKVRKSTDDKVQSDGEFHGIDEKLNIPISIDSTGNREVQTIIEDLTGYTVSSGKGSIFQNFIISHIWGKAYDPRYFTNLWNLAIVPAWGNFLLDKSDSQDELTLKMINTFKAIAFKRYKMSTLDWQSINLCGKNMRQSGKYVVSGTYFIHVIENKNGRIYGAIKKIRVTI